MKAPTITGPLIFTTPDQLCAPGVAGCSQGEIFYPVPGYAQDATEIAASDRWSLYFELGHQFDYRYLTDADHAYLAWFWRVSGAAWADSAASLSHGQEDGLEAQFAYAYAVCAQTGGYFDSTGAAFSNYSPPPIYPRNPWGTCAFIDRIG
jgi:hypothetical protein